MTDASNAQVTALRTLANDRWDPERIGLMRIPERMLPAVVDSSGIVGPATALRGAPPIAGILGDQQASLLGQGCVRPGDAKITFGTGGMLDLVLGGERPAFPDRSGAGCFPIVTRRLAGTDQWGLEAAMLAAGTNVEWLRDDLGIIATAEESDTLAASLRRHGRRVVRPRAARARHAEVRLRRPRHPARPDTRNGASRGRARGPGGDRPSRRRPRRGGRSRCGAARRRAPCRRRHGRELDLRAGLGRRDADASSRSRPSAKRRRSVPRSRPGSPSGSGRATTRSPRRGARPRASSHAEPLDRERWQRGRSHAEGWIPELSTIDL